MPVLTSFIAGAQASPAPGRARLRHPARASVRGPPRGFTGCSGPVRSPSERSSGLPSPPSGPRHEVPGFGAVCLAHPARVLDRRAGISVDLRLSARADRRWRTCRRLRSLLAANQVDRRDLSCSRADPDGYGSPITPHRVLARVWTKARAASVEGRENVESLGNGGGPDGDRPPGRMIRTDRTGRRRGSISPRAGTGRDSVELAEQTAIPREPSSGGNPGSAVPVVCGVVPTGRGARHGACPPPRPRGQSWLDGDAGCAHSCRAHHRALQTSALVAIRSNRAMNQKPLTAGPSPRRSA